MNELKAIEIFEKLKDMNYEKGCKLLENYKLEERGNKDKELLLFDHDFIIDEDNYFSFKCRYKENKESDYIDQDTFYLEEGKWSLMFNNNHHTY